MKQGIEQPSDWTIAGLHPVADGVYRIPLALPLQDLSVVNCYLFISDNNVVLVDPGFSTPDTERLLADALRKLNLHPSDVDRIIATHTHWDHYSQAISLREKYGIPISIGKEERHTVVAESLQEGLYPLQIKRLYSCGAAPLARRVLALPREDHEIGVPYGAPDSYLSEGERIPLGRRDLIIHETPGHTRGHIVISDPLSGVQVTGDHILPRITPSLGLELRPERFPLTSFMSSLNACLRLPDAMMLPAHGAVSDSVHERAKALLQHHQERLDEIAAKVDAGASTALEVASNLTWTRRGRDLSELNPIHQMLAVLEVAAHLDMLSVEGLVQETIFDDVMHYVLA